MKGTEAITDEDPEANHLLNVNRTAENYGMPSCLRQNIWFDSSHNDSVQTKSAKDF